MQPQPPPGYTYAPPPPPRSNTLWIVLGIVGGAIAVIVGGLVFMGGSAKSMKKTKRNEAEVNLARIEKAAKAHYAETAAFPSAEAGPTPAIACCDQGERDRKCVPDSLQWYGGAWDELGFSVDEPHAFYYQYVPAADGQSFTAYAIGDLDCDDNVVAYELKGSIEAGNPVFVLTKPARAD